VAGRSRSWAGVLCMGQDVVGALAESDGSRNLLNGMSDKNFHIQSNKICLLIR